MKDLIGAVRPFLSVISKAKGGKLFRVLLDNFLEIDNATDEQVAVTAECIEWTIDAKRRFLKQTLEIILTKLHIKARQFQDALAVAQVPHPHCPCHRVSRVAPTRCSRCRHVATARINSSSR
jgi:26S proteasome regulatory subunit N6